MTDIRLPNITATSTEGQMVQMKSYLYQMVEQLNWALSLVRSNATVENSADIELAPGGAMTKQEAQGTFNAIKDLIIKSADIVTAYETSFRKSIAGQYVAVSDFGSMTENAMQDLEVSPTAIKQYFTDTQELQTEMDGIGTIVRDVSASIKSGLLYYDDDGTPVYGLEVGQFTDEDGVPVDNKYARFTPGRLSFYDQNGDEVSYVSDYKLYITNAVVKGNLQLGGYIADTSNGIAFKWVGRE